MTDNDDPTKYQFQNLQGGSQRSGPLWLEWELDRDWLTDDYDPSEVSAGELLAEWVHRTIDDGQHVPFVPIYWSVRGEAIEAAPFQHTDSPLMIRAHARCNYLQFFSWPTDEGGEDVQWARLHVADKLWRPGHPDKGGFMQEATGWKPSPLQDRLHWPNLLLASGFSRLVPAGLTSWDSFRAGNR